MKSILITGASGFIGSFIVEEALRQGYTVWAGVRKTSSRRYLADSRINFLEMDFAHKDILAAQLEAHRRECGAFDYVVHCAGATKCRHRSDFFTVNLVQTSAFVDTLRSLDMVPKRFIFVSTLSVFGPIREADYSAIRESDSPEPNTAYGKSKLEAERYISSLGDFPYIFLRPTGVYGPREMDYFLMAKSIKSHVDFSVGYRRQDLTFVYVKDVVQAVFAAIDSGVVRRAYFLTDGGVYPSRAFSDLIQREMGVKGVVRIKSPLWFLKVVSFVAERLARMAGKSSTLNMDKYNIMKQRNWQCDITPAVEEIGYKPEYNLERGVVETIKWYKKEGWL
jgi:UDP-glucose 4-epimerase